MLKELIYLGSGIEKKITDKLEELIKEGKKDYGDKDLLEMGKIHLKKRKEQVNKLFLGDVRELVDEIGLATKKDIEELKRHIKK